MSSAFCKSVPFTTAPTPWGAFRRVNWINILFHTNVFELSKNLAPLWRSCYRYEDPSIAYFEELTFSSVTNPYFSTWCRLQKLADGLVEKFVTRGLMKEEYDKVNIRAPLMKCNRLTESAAKKIVEVSRAVKMHWLTVILRATSIWFHEVQISIEKR